MFLIFLHKELVIKLSILFAKSGNIFKANATVLYLCHHNKDLRSTNTQKIHNLSNACPYMSYALQRREKKWCTFTIYNQGLSVIIKT